MTTPIPAKPLPVYLQIAELLARRIKAGHWREDERLPTEAELSTQLNVAVGTLRKSLALLAKQGVVERIQGSGTYVKKAAGTGQIYELFRLELNSGPGLPTALILDVSLELRPADVPAFGNGRSTHAWRVRRLRSLSHVPVALEEIWFNGDHVQNLSVHTLGDSMYLFYQENFGIWIARVEDRISVNTAPMWACPPFGISPGQPTGFIERVSRTSTNEVAEFSQTWFDPSMCCYSSRLSQ